MCSDNRASATQSEDGGGWYTFHQDHPKSPAPPLVTHTAPPVPRGMPADAHTSYSCPVHHGSQSRYGGHSQSPYHPPLAPFHPPPPPPQHHTARKSLRQSVAPAPRDTTPQRSYTRRRCSRRVAPKAMWTDQVTGLREQSGGYRRWWIAHGHEARLGSSRSLSRSGGRLDGR